MDTQLRLGIIGIAGRGRMHMFWHKPNGRSIVAGAADIRQENLDEFKHDVNKDAFVTLDYHELLARKDIDAIAVCSPDNFHEEQAIAALEAGKPVYCEKPMAVTIDGCDNMIRAAHRTGQKLMIGHNMRYAPYARKLHELVHQGVIGDVKAVWVRHFVGRGSLYYYHDWHADKRNTTSLLLQKGCHDIDTIHYVTGHYTKRLAAFGSLDFFGGHESNQKQCRACERQDTCKEYIDMSGMRHKRYHDYCVFRDEVNVPDNYVCILELDNGIKASYTECHFTPDYHRNFTFIGTEGRIENSEPHQKVWLWKRENASHDDPDAEFDLTVGIDKDGELGHGGADQFLCREFVDMVLDGREPIVPLAAGRNAVAVGCLAQKSLEKGGGVYEVPPIKG